MVDKAIISEVYGKMKENLPLQKGVIYGPVYSRRLGISLGLNILSIKYKFCHMNCIYCQYGWTQMQFDGSKIIGNDLPSAEEIEISLKDSLIKLREEKSHLDYITFSGNGEGTLHPDFCKIVNIVIKLRNEYYPGSKTAILSNSATVGDKAIRECLERLDKKIMKLDAGDEETFKKINHPPSYLSLEKIVNGLKLLNRVTIQSLFVDGPVTNTRDWQIEAWIEKLKIINPEEVEIYTIDRLPADRRIIAVSKEKMKEIAFNVKSSISANIQVW